MYGMWVCITVCGVSLAGDMPYVWWKALATNLLRNHWHVWNCSVYTVTESSLLTAARAPHDQHVGKCMTAPPTRCTAVPYCILPDVVLLASHVTCCRATAAAAAG